MSTPKSTTNINKEGLMEPFSSNPAAPITLRMAVPSDAEEMLAIYAFYVENTAVTFEYQTPDAEEFKRRIIHTLERYPYLAALYQGRIIGYAYASPFKTRAAYDWAVETSIYVQKDFHGHGVGKRLYLALEDLLRQQNILNSNACITYPNPESIHFHEALGYRMVAHFSKCGYKLGRWHDMVWMEKHLAQHPEHPEPEISVNNCLPISGL